MSWKAMKEKEAKKIAKKKAGGKQKKNWKKKMLEKGAGYLQVCNSQHLSNFKYLKISDLSVL